MGKIYVAKNKSHEKVKKMAAAVSLQTCASEQVVKERDRYNEIAILV